MYGGRWQVIKQIGGGGQAHTFLVRDTDTGRAGYVLKRLLNIQRVARFEREIKAYSNLDSSHVPKLVDHSVEEPAYLVTEFVGIDMQKLAQKGDRPAIEEVLRRFQGVVEAARDAHALGLVHRDIKPNNITLDEDGNVYLIDFGICADNDAGVLLTTTSEGFGNPAFAAPECQLGSQEEATPASDMYSLGKVLYWMTSHGDYINREDMSRVEETIRHPSSWARRYVAALVGRAVTARTPAEELLGFLEVVTSKLSEHEQLQLDGLFPLLDGFGPDFSFNASSSRSAISPPRGNPPHDGDVALGIQPSTDLEVVSVEMGIRRAFGGNDQLDVAIVADDGGHPGTDSLARDTLTVPQNTTILRWEPDESVRLRSDKLYWITLSASLPDSDIALCGAHEILWNTSGDLIGERIDLKDWRIARTSGYAVRVLARHQQADFPPA